MSGYQTQWKDDYLGGKLIIADRYTTSNAAHQMVKLPKEQWDGFSPGWKSMSITSWASLGWTGSSIWIWSRRPPKADRRAGTRG